MIARTYGRKSVAKVDRQSLKKEESIAKVDRQRKLLKLSLSGSVCVSAEWSWAGEGAVVWRCESERIVTLWTTQLNTGSTKNQPPLKMRRTKTTCSHLSSILFGGALLASYQEGPTCWIQVKYFLMIRDFLPILTKLLCFSAREIEGSVKNIYGWLNFGDAPSCHGSSPSSNPHISKNHEIGRQKQRSGKHMHSFLPKIPKKSPKSLPWQAHCDIHASSDWTRSNKTARCSQCCWTGCGRGGRAATHWRRWARCWSPGPPSLSPWRRRGRRWTLPPPQCARPTHAGQLKTQGKGHRVQTVHV